MSTDFVIVKAKLGAESTTVRSAAATESENFLAVVMGFSFKRV